MDYYVYLLLDPRKFYAPFYIGKGKDERLNESLRRSHNSFVRNICKAIRKAGLEPVASIWKPQLSEAEAFDLECELIARFGRRGIDPGGILANRTLGGEGASGYTVEFSEERRRKISEAQKGRKLSSEETRKKLSESHRGLKQSEETKAKRSASMKGRKLSPEHIEKLRSSKTGAKNPNYGKVSSRKGKPANYSEDVLFKIKDARAKQEITPETRAKMSEAHRRKHAQSPMSDETKRRISEARKRAWARKKETGDPITPQP